MVRLLMLTLGLATLSLASGPLLSWLAQSGGVRLVNIDRPGSLFLDWRLDQIGRSPTVCQNTLGSQNFRAHSVDDKPIVKGCGWQNAVRVSSVGGATVPPVILNCGAAAALAWWVTQDVQPIALKILGSRVATVQHAGGYNCRDIRDSADTENGQRSEHATANAIDVTSLTLVDGRAVSIKNDWHGTGPKALFLRQVFLASCKYFRTALGPDYNSDHADHFHLDRGQPDECP